MNVTIIGISSDIGFELGYRFIAEGARLQGTYRTNKPDDRITAASPMPDCASPYFVECDMTNHVQIISVAEKLEPWDLLIFAVGTMEPVGKFEDTAGRFGVWGECFRANLLGPLLMLHQLYQKRRPNASVCFFAGPNPNKANPGFSAYSIAKTALIKATEELNEELDPKVFILGPGYVKTKIHQQSGVFRETGTSHDVIFDLLKRCISLPKNMVGGRNIVVGDDRKKLGYELEESDDFGKLRRFECVYLDPFDIRI